jgi:hypothetical protein
MIIAQVRTVMTELHRAVRPAELVLTAPIALGLLVVTELVVINRIAACGGWAFAHARSSSSRMLTGRILRS